MKKLFIPYKLAKLAKEKGFDEPCFATYDYSPFEDIKDEIELIYEVSCFKGVVKNSTTTRLCTAPLYQQIIDWFEKQKHGIIDDTVYFSYDQQKWAVNNRVEYRENDFGSKFFNSRYEALDEEIENGLSKLK